MFPSLSRYTLNLQRPKSNDRLGRCEKPIGFMTSPEYEIQSKHIQDRTEPNHSDRFETMF